MPENVTDFYHRQKMSNRLKNVTIVFTNATLTIKITILTIVFQIIGMMIILSRIRYVIRLMEWIDDMLMSQIFTTDRKRQTHLPKFYKNVIISFVTDQVCDQADGMDRRYDN